MFHLRILALGLLAAVVSTAGFAGEIPDRALVFELQDPDGELRRGLGEADAADRLAWLRANVAPAYTLEQTVERAVALGLQLGWDEDGRDQLDDPCIGEWLALAAAQIAVDRFPEAASGLSSSILDPQGDSPVCQCFEERIPRCPGCSVSTTGPRDCDFSVNCNGPFGHGCMSIEIQHCIASHAIGILFPLPRR